MILRKLLASIRAYRIVRKKGPLHSIFSPLKNYLKITTELCGINAFNRNLFLSDIDYVKNHPYNGAYSGIIDNKLYLPLLLKDYLEYLPTYYYFVDYKGILSLTSLEVDQELDKYSQLLDLLRNKGKLVAKHTHSSSGVGFYLLAYFEGIYLVNKKEYTQEALIEFIKQLDGYIITEYVNQHSYASLINESSLNTMRLLTYWDFRTKKTEVFSAFQRFGCNNSIVDNIGSGNGLLSFVDPSSGILTGKGEFMTPNDGDHYSEDLVHPNSQIRLKGVQIPHYEVIKNKVLEIADSISFIQYAGWDIAITDKSFKIVEINSRPSLDVVQQRNGFLTNEGLRKILKK